MKERLIVLNAGATREAVTKGHLQDIDILTPSPSLMKMFDESAGPLHRRKDKSNSETASLTKLRDTLLPKLLSGELRIPDAEKLVSGSL